MQNTKDFLGIVMFGLCCKHEEVDAVNGPTASACYVVLLVGVFGGCGIRKIMYVPCPTPPRLANADDK